MRAILASLLLAMTAFIAQPSLAETADNHPHNNAATLASTATGDNGASTNLNHVLLVFFTNEGQLVIKGDITPNNIKADTAQLATTLRQMAAPGAYIYLRGSNAKSYAEIEQVQRQINLARKLIEPPKGEL